MILFYMVTDQENPNQYKHRKITVDEAIFPRIAENDKVAFEELYLLTHKSVYSFALSILRNHDDALDVLQETYLKIRGAAHLYRPMGKPIAWIFTITRNLAMSKLRTVGKSCYLNEELLEEDLTFSYVTDRDDKLVLQAALTILELEEREIILLHAVSGFKHREIADNLGLSLGTVLSKYHRALEKLRKHLKDRGYNHE